MFRNRREKRAHYRDRQSKNHTVATVKVFGASTFEEWSARVRVPDSEELPTQLIVLGKNSNHAFCLETGKVFQMTSGWYESIGRSISPDFVKEEYEKAQMSILNSALKYLCWPW